jgi:glutathione synthase/RimK-type ligase-like ATP-grasp enzyme
VTIAIHHREGSFSAEWIAYCERHDIRFRVVNCYATDVVEQLRDCDALMWHWHHSDHAAALFARQLAYALEKAGKAVFPSFDTSLFFDDKIGQKYLLEAIGVAHASTSVFFSRNDALSWANRTPFPKVFKLSKGAGGKNVRLVRNAREARRLISRAFGLGFPVVASYAADIQRRVTRNRTWGGLLQALLRAPWTIASIRKRNRSRGVEKGYAYWQEFIPGLNADTRVVIVGNKAFTIRRSCLPDDFRASGSGLKDYSPGPIDKRCIEIAFAVSKKLGFQSMAYDFVLRDGLPLVLEMSYTFQTRVYPGYFDEQLVWQETETDVAHEIIQNLLQSSGYSRDCLSSGIREMRAATKR